MSLKCIEQLEALFKHLSLTPLSTWYESVIKYEGAGHGVTSLFECGAQPDIVVVEGENCIAC